MSKKKQNQRVRVLSSARQLNKMYGLHVTPTIDLTTYKPRNDAPFLKRLYFRLIK